LTDKELTKEEMDKLHRKFGVKWYNKTWDYLDKKELTSKEELEMLAVTHASMQHWSFIGKPINFASSYWQISRVYTVLNEGNLALRYAKTCLEITEKNNIKSLLLSANEGIARAYAILKDFSQAKSYLDKAYKEYDTLADEEDKKIYIDQLEDTKSLIK
jgi:tetratricopeptide (TPR) repeat protein